MIEPHNIEAEQAILGAILVNNDCLHRCEKLTDKHFYDPVHARLFAAMQNRINENRLVSPVTMKGFVEKDISYEDLGGPAYLVRMAGASISLFAVKDYSVLIQECWAKRDLLDAINNAQQEIETNEEITVPQVAAELETRLADNRNEGGGKPLSRSFLYGMTKAITSIAEAYHGEAPAGLQTGLKAIDDVLGGLRGGRSYVLAGRPSMGKTSIAVNIANRVAMQKKNPVGVIIVSLEMTDEELSTRTISQVLRESGQKVAYTRLEKGWLSEGEMKSVVEMAPKVEATQIRTISDATELNDLISAVRATARQFTEQMPLGLIVVDYLQLINVKGCFNETQEVGRASVAMKHLAKELDVPVLTLSQLNRSVEQRENKRPVLSDLRQSGRIEEDADVVIFCYRPAYYLEREIAGETNPIEQEDMRQDLKKIENDLELIFAKVRAGKIQTTKLNCEVAYNHLYDLVDAGQGGFDV